MEAMSAQTYELAGEIPDWLPHDRLEKARRHRGLNQDELAERLGMSRRTVSSYEAGVREPKRPIIIAWAMATGVNLRWLETGEASEPVPPVPPVGLEPTTCGLKGPGFRPVTELYPVARFELERAS